MSTRQDPVPPVLRSLLTQLASLSVTKDFYLAGGTGLALQLRHRRSVDLDFFSRTNRLDAGGRQALVARLRRLPGWALIEAKDGTVHGQVGRVRVSFFWYDEPLVRPLTRQGGVRIASVEDIGLMKIGAVIGRGSRKDFVDLYAVCQRVPLARLLGLGRRKFADSRDFSFHALKALAFFEDAEREPAVRSAAPVAWPQVKDFFTTQVRAIGRRYLRY